MKHPEQNTTALVVNQPTNHTVTDHTIKLEQEKLLHRRKLPKLNESPFAAVEKPETPHSAMAHTVNNIIFNEVKILKLHNERYLK
jgi:hypothetical protein